ncbi:tRNA (cmo5U34)-methyltransferase [Methyloprofundus sedimenti]|uniref:Carboxy-S-adenosyl-L-methionine synthase n=1 Tax=Methyloprofundus sedimenti TaxID=1420851 RepID=A0A1V8M5R5_9GAMM|nr:carboxy-S-adenosyl-L-methionine synthase CmoA [Methyloprofundus sedimenti]OQK16895.1 tRNA (cmo5U34)-methyltransferase [Methyloprofundus sedimenti]
MNLQKDTLYASPLGDIDGFKFDASVVDVFPDMIQRSVPGYSAIISAIGLLASRFAQADSVCYDLGCSLGAATLSMRHKISAANCKIIAVDNSTAMLSRCEKIITRDTASIPVELVCSDIQDIKIQNASVVVLNFTLQFIPLADRNAFIKKIYAGLRPGGLLVLSEKLFFSDLRQQSLQTEMHHAFKKANGYSDMEISQKRASLENVLIPETFTQHKNRLLQSGFDNAEVWFQYFNFASIIALK